MQCRTNKRATWAAQLAADAGLQHCLIYRQVTMHFTFWCNVHPMWVRENMHNMHKHAVDVHPEVASLVKFMMKC